MLRFCALIILAAVSVTADDFQGSTHITPFDEDTIAYSKSETDGPIPRLQKRIEKGEIDPSFVISHHMSLDDAPSGYDKFMHKADACTKIVLKAA